MIFEWKGFCILQKQNQRNFQLKDFSHFDFIIIQSQVISIFYFLCFNIAESSIRGPFDLNMDLIVQQLTDLQSTVSVDKDYIQSIPAILDTWNIILRAVKSAMDVYHTDGSFPNLQRTQVDHMKQISQLLVSFNFIIFILLFHGFFFLHDTNFRLQKKKFVFPLTCPWKKRVGR